MRSFLSCALALVVVGCGGDGAVDAGPLLDSPSDVFSPDAGDLGPADLGFDAGRDAGPDLGFDAGPPDAGPTCGLLARTHVVTGLDNPIYATAPPGDARIFVLEARSGHVLIVDSSGAHATPFLDVSVDLDAVGYEAGLLSLAFHPDYATHAQVYVSYTRPGGILRVARFDVPAATPDAVDAASVTTIIDIPAGVTGAHHDTGGMLAFGADGYLYIGVGDQSLDSNGQNTATLDGKILRIDVDATGVPYAVPSTNPLVSTPSARPEIWAYGLREPYRFAFDDVTHDLYLAEVGDATWEEVNVVAAGDPGGENFGWPTAEGSGCHTPPFGCSMAGLTAPTYEYLHDATMMHAAIMGGHVYRGAALGSCWQGRYFFGDYELGWVRSLRYDATSGVTDVEQHDEITLGMLVSLGRDGNGEVLLVGVDGSVDRIVPHP